MVGYIQGCKVFQRSEALGEHVEVYDAKMVGLHAAAEEAWRYITCNETHPKPDNLIFYADNSAAISKIFEGSHGKAQAHSRAFRKNISKILNETERIKIAISWCPHQQNPKMLWSPPEDWEDWEFLEEIGPSGNSLELLELQMSPGAHCFSKVLRRAQVLQRAPESSGACTASKKKEFSELLFYSYLYFLNHLLFIYGHVLYFCIYIRNLNKYVIAMV